MKWLILLFVLVIAGAVAKDGCHVREFYGIGYTIHNPSERHQQMVRWLKKQCAILQSIGLCSYLEQHC
jgi:hypothetical protein